MIFPELEDPEISVYLDDGEDGWTCNRAATPAKVLKILDEISKDYFDFMGEKLISFYNDTDVSTEDE